MNVRRAGDGPLSNDATLKSLTVSSGVLQPAFAADKTEYTVNVPENVTTITITGVENHAGATVAGNVTGRALNVGSNPVTITVTAEDGTTKKTYTVTVIRGSVTNEEDNFASELNIYPNPFTGDVRITGAMVGAGLAPAQQIQVINAAGAIVHIQMITSPDEIIRLEHLPAGVYFFRIENNGKTKTVKMVKN